MLGVYDILNLRARIWVVPENEVNAVLARLMLLLSMTAPLNYFHEHSAKREL